MNYLGSRPICESRSVQRYRWPIERGLLNDEGKLSGRAQAAMRAISDVDFVRIVDRGLEDRDPLLPREGALDQRAGFGEDQAPYVLEPQL